MTGNRIEVFLNIYDLSQQNKILSKFGCGFYHCGVQVGPQEYAFGQGEVTPQTTYDELVEQTGVHRCEPKQAPGAVFRQALSMGHTTMTYSEIDRLVNRMSQQYKRADYNLFVNNCNWFCDDLCVALTGKAIPSHINRMANFAGWFHPASGEDPKIKEKRLAARRPPPRIQHTHYPRMNPKIDLERTDVSFTTVRGVPAWGAGEFKYSTAYNLAWGGALMSVALWLLFAFGWFMWGSAMVAIVIPHAIYLFLFLLLLCCTCTLCFLPCIWPCGPCFAIPPMLLACIHPPPLFAACCGAHRLYLGKPRSALLWGLTGGLFGVGQILDFLLLQEYVDEANEMLTTDPEAGRAGDVPSGGRPGARRLGGSQVLHIEDIRLQRINALQRTSNSANTTNPQRQAEIIAERELREQQNREFEAALQYDIERKKKEKRPSLDDPSPSHSKASPALPSMASERDDTAVQAERAMMCEAILSTLPPEPAADTPCSMIKVLLPDGSHATRRFAPNALVGEVLGFANGRAGASIHSIDDYVLVSDFPKMVYTDVNTTLSEAGLIPSALLRLSPKDVAGEGEGAIGGSNPATFGFAPAGTSRSHGNSSANSAAGDEPLTVSNTPGLPSPPSLRSLIDADDNKLPSDFSGKEDSAGLPDGEGRSDVSVVSNGNGLGLVSAPGDTNAAK